MGEMNLLRGSLTFPKDHSMSFCAQDPWLRVGFGSGRRIVIIWIADILTYIATDLAWRQHPPEYPIPDAFQPGPVSSHRQSMCARHRFPHMA